MKLQKVLGQNIKKARNRKHLTQEQLAELVELSPKHISRIEVGTKFVTAESLQRIAAVLQVEPAALFTTSKDFLPSEVHVISFSFTGKQGEEVAELMEYLSQLASK